MLKCFLDCSARVIRSCGGEITAYDGDRIMAVFLGGSKNTSAGFAALKINHTVKKIINPAIAEFYKGTEWFAKKPYAIRHVVGVDSGELHVAKTGVRGANDLVWVGRPAFFAAKLSALRFEDYPSLLSTEVYNMLAVEPKKWKDQEVWTSLGTWNGRGIYGSKWQWEPDYSA
jgi:class 3 adenylate cyclase